jgi:hypothetical protein
MGYSGYNQTSRDGHLAWGLSSVGGIVQASGQVAQRLAVVQADWFTPRFRTTRLDLALTFSLGAPQELVREVADRLRPNWRIILPAPGVGGGTLYVGSRVSDAFGRLYDKGAQLTLDPRLKDEVIPCTLWRAEVEYKQARAREAMIHFNVHKAPDDRRHWIADTVLTWFAEHGVALPLLPGSRSIVSVASRQSDDVRTIKWFYEQVRPALIRLSDKGQLTQALDALGLDPSLSTLKTLEWVGDGVDQFSFFDKLV